MSHYHIFFQNKNAHKINHLFYDKIGVLKGRNAHLNSTPFDLLVSNRNVLNANKNYMCILTSSCSFTILTTAKLRHAASTVGILCTAKIVFPSGRCHPIIATSIACA